MYEIHTHKKARKEKREGEEMVYCNSECIRMKKRSQNLARLLLKHPKDPFIRGQYFKSKKACRRTVKAQKSNFEKQAIDTLQSLSANPKGFWAFLKEIRWRAAQGNTPLSSEVWVNHFSALTQRDPSSEHVNSAHVSNIKNLVNNALFSSSE